MIEDGLTYDTLRGVSIEGTAEIVDDPETLRVGVSVWERYTGPVHRRDEAVRRSDAEQAHRGAGRAGRLRSWDHRKLGMPEMPLGGTTAAVPLDKVGRNAPSNWTRRCCRRSSSTRVRRMCGSYRRTGGRIGGKWRIGAGFRKPVPTLLLEHRGRKSGKVFVKRRCCTCSTELDVVIVASQGGRAEDPQLYRNLVAIPDVLHRDRHGPAGRAR